ncbi:heme d1 biosynthesis radical SAM protein NirJ [Kistimonas asteriae]|uniref:heme d1 biosynthesis radical SAM protein NirJ n=1 Tax=Kistimonas asteriae TaxID=517724 RepID=UPI001BAC1981|nr:heme d1 biosynthesis radical SAM protein NirJ [Kistimonas asteriae]
MFRISQYMKTLYRPTPVRAAASPTGPVVIWNLIRRCNLTCRHCYSISADVDFPGELNTEQVFSVMDDLKQFRVPVLILSGGEPLLRPDIFAIGQRAKALGFYVGLSSNGTLITEENIGQIAATGFDYVGISIDGLKQTHDRFRQMPGGFDAALRGVRLCKEAGIKVGLRFTLTRDNAAELPALLDIMDEHDVDKFYLSHLNYAGRGKRSRKRDAFHQMTREAIELLFTRCWSDITNGRERDYVTGNNDADGPLLLQWTRKHLPEQAETLEQRLVNWGGNASGVNIANIDNTGIVHPDTYWWDHNLGNVKETPFSTLWRETDDALMQGFRQKPRPVKGRCGQCRYLAICGGNTRTRAFTTTGDPWAEDPGCYLSDDEIGVMHSPVPETIALQQV